MKICVFIVYIFFYRIFQCFEHKNSTYANYIKIIKSNINDKFEIIIYILINEIKNISILY